MYTPPLRRALLFGLFVALAACGARKATTPTGPTVEDARAFYGSQPRYLSPVVLGEPVPEGLPDVRAATCGACHVDIYEEWRISTHARAWLDDPQFQAELHKRPKKGGDTGWMCVNCHTPVEAQLEGLVVGLEDGRLDRPIYVDNPSFDATMQLEAITCAACHLKDGHIVGPYGDTNAPHATKKSDDLLSEAVCTRCHQAAAVFPEITMACSFTTGEEFAASPAAKEGKRCQSCHMPEVDRPLMAGFPERPTRRHWFGGSMIPKKPEFAAELEALHDVYPDGLDVAWGTLPESIRPGEVVEVEVVYANARAGHHLPTGDPERFLALSAKALGPDGTVLAEADARLGIVYRWWPDIEKLSDNRLAPGEERRLTLRFTVPADGPVTLVGDATKWRISPENLAYHDLEGKVPPSKPIWSDRRALPLGGL